MDIINSPLIVVQVFYKIKHFSCIGYGSGRPKFGPVAKTGTSKYGPNGLFTKESFKNTGLSMGLCEQMAKVANYSLSKSTWSSYRTVKRQLENCQKDLNIKFYFPMSSSHIVVFVAWLVSKGLTAATIKSYISGVRTIHLSQGVDEAALRPPIVNSIIDGKAHVDTIISRLKMKPRRLPVTLNLLKLIKAKINAWEESDGLRLLVWTVSLICFFGGFRIHEILSRNKSTFDPAFTLLAKDIKIARVKIGKETLSTLQILIKSPKEDRIGREFIIDLYETKGKFCPVKYFLKWIETKPPVSKNKPAFLKPDGTPLTGAEFNKFIKMLLREHIDYNKTKISTHSFRGGMATLLGQLGYSDEDIQAMGRWSSRAFETYIKLPRSKRVAMAKKLASHCSE